MATSPRHYYARTTDGIHINIRFIVADAAGRGSTTITDVNRGAITIQSTDIGSAIYQQDTREIYYLTDTGPAEYKSATTSGSGDVVGPASATDNAIARYDTTTGKLIQDSGITVGDSEEVVGVGSIQLKDVAAPANPGAGKGELYKKTGNDGLFWKPDAAGPEVDLTDSGSGDVTGPASSTDNALPRFDGAGGKTLQGSSVIVDDSNNVSGIVNLVQTGYIEVADIAAPANPGAGKGRLYKKSGNDGLFYLPDAAGPEVDLTTVGSDVNVRVSSDDTTPGDLETKVLAGTGIALSTQNGGGNETRTITAKRLVPVTFHWSVVLLFDTDGDNWYLNNNAGDYRYPYWMRGEETSWGSSSGGTVAPSSIPNNVQEGFTVPITGTIVSISLTGTATNTSGMDMYFCLMGGTHTNEGASGATVTKNEIVSPMMLWDASTSSTVKILASTEGVGTSITINSTSVTACDNIYPLIAVDDPGALGSTRCEFDFIGQIVIEET